MQDSLASGTAQGLIDYLESLVTKGRSRDGVIAPLKTATVKVLEKTEGEKWGSVDIVKLDFDDVMARFKNLTRGIYNKASYQAYESRLKRAASWYIKFLEDPGWYPTERLRSKKVDSIKTDLVVGDKKPNHANPPSAAKVSTINISSSSEAQKSDAVAYPFPLANGELARVFMPKGVTRADIRRLAAFLEALVIEPEKDKG